MRYWLFKSEPSTWSWEEQLAAGRDGAEWDGVRNYSAQANMKAMRVGDLGFFYHSMSERSVVGVVEVCAEASADSTDPRWECVHVRAVATLPSPVSLADVKADETLRSSALSRNPRLSVQPLSAREWTRIRRMGGLKSDDPR